MFTLLDPSAPGHVWVPLWARMTHELLTSLATLEREGEAHWEDELDAWVTEYGFDDSLDALVKAAFARSGTEFEQGVEALLELIGETDPDDLRGRLFDALEELASTGTWFDPDGGDGSFGTDLSGETLLFGMGFTLTCPFDSLRRAIESPQQVDAVAAALVRDGQVIPGHRLVLLPVLLDANARECLDEWSVNRLREQLEDWMAENSAGHPDSAAGWAMLHSSGIESKAAVQYARLDGTRAAEDNPSGFGVQSWMLVGLLARTNVPRADSAAPFIVSTVSFPRAEIGPLLETLGEEADAVARDLATAEERGSYEAEVFLQGELKRIEREAESIEAAFAEVMGKRRFVGGSAHEALENLVQRALTTRPLEPCVDALTVANEFFPAWRDVVSSHRKVAFQALLTVAAVREGWDDLAGASASLVPGDEPGVLKVKLQLANVPSRAILLWPAVPWQTSYDSLAEVVALLKAHGVRLTHSV